jgi:hypothetical protein
MSSISIWIEGSVIPGRLEEANPESRDSGFDAIASPRNDCVPPFLNEALIDDTIAALAAFRRIRAPWLQSTLNPHRTRKAA